MREFMDGHQIYLRERILNFEDVGIEINHYDSRQCGITE